MILLIANATINSFFPHSQASGVNVEVSTAAKSEDAVIYQDGFEILSSVDVIKIDNSGVTNIQGKF
jgi:hypothetical protein